MDAPPASRAIAGTALVAIGLLAVAPSPVALLRGDAPVRLPIALDPALRLPFASILLRSGAVNLRPGDRIAGLRVPGDGGLHIPRDRTGLLDTLGGIGAGGSVVLEVRGAGGGARSLEVATLRDGGRDALAEQWPVLLTGGALLSFALASIVGGRHPVVTPLFAVSWCLGVAVLASIDLVLPGDAGVLALPQLRARAGVLAWTALPAALLHLAARFPVVVPRFRRRSLAALPYALWSIPALLAQLRFGDAAVMHAVERVALTTSFGAGGVLVAVCVRPGRALAPVERVRARAATLGLAAAGSGPLVAFVAGAMPSPGQSTLMALAPIAFPVSLGWAVARYRLLDPPPWLRRTLVSGIAVLAALVLSAGLLPAIWSAIGATGRSPAAGSALALLTALVYQGFRSAIEQLARRGVAVGAPGELLARASREWAGAASPGDVLAGLGALLRDGFGAGAVEIVVGDAEPSSELARRGLALRTRAPAGLLLCAPRCEDPDPVQPEALLRIEPRLGASVLAVMAPRPDGLPYTAEERRSLEDLARLAALALGDAAASAQLERRVAARTAALRRALADRTALLAAAERIQSARDAGEVRAAVIAFLADRSDAVPHHAESPARAPGRIVAEIQPSQSRSEWLTVEGLAVARARDLQPQADTVCALASLALERLHGLAGLKLEVERQARELAHAASGRRLAEFVRSVAHELRKPNEEIRHLVRPLREQSAGPAREALARVEQVTHELGRRLDLLLSRQGGRRDTRRLDLVRLVDDAARRVALLRSRRRFEVRHERARLPLLGDPVRLASVIENLLDNAVKATADGGRVAISSGLRCEAARPLVWVEVEDDGCGIAPDLADELFEPGVGRFRDGFGLGLTLCREVVAQHGGQIEVESAPGRTRFRVELPQQSPTACAERWS
ncbi:MAG TPA: HAMP domain-containing sensor histidine kinase [Myxococcota bacterium]|nr:HAMP domain-containing sensor histidine kinase [Myxococcota bacterium]